MRRLTLLPLALLLVACPADDPDTGDTDTDTNTGPIVSNPAVDPQGPANVVYDEYYTYTVTGLDDRQAYRVTLVHGDYITAAGDGTAVFQDSGQGTANAGPSEEIALITNVNGGDWIPGFKTVPGAADDPANPSGVHPEGGQLVLQITGVTSGTVYPVVYHNEGASTFLEIDGTGVPVETYAVGGGLSVEGPEPIGPVMAPADPQTVEVDDYYDYTISGLDDLQAFRVTLVHSDNITTGPDQTGTFVDGDANGAADAGPSETVALLSQVNGTDLATPAKTYPAGDDDPTAPSGIFPVGGEITVRLTGVGEGTVYPVAYYNGGASTFLELDPTTYMPTETYVVGGSFSVTLPPPP